MSSPGREGNGIGVRGDGNMEGGCRSALRKGEGIGGGGKEGDYFCFCFFFYYPSMNM